MQTGSPAAAPPEDERPNRRARLLATRGRKIAAIVGGAFLATIGGVIATWVVAVGETTTKKVLNDGSPPLTVRVLPRGAFEDTLILLPYYIVPAGEAPGPDAFSRPELRGVVENPAQSSAWARAHDAVDGSPQVVNLELRATTDEPVTVTGIKVTVLERGAPVEGWFVAAVTGCGAEPIRLALVDLDAPIPKVEYYESDASPTAERLAFSVTRTDVELIQLKAKTRDSLVDWQAEISFSGAEGDGSVIVDDHGQPFRVSTEIGGKAYSYEGQGQVRRAPDWDRGITVC